MTTSTVSGEWPDIDRRMPPEYTEILAEARVRGWYVRRETLNDALDQVVVVRLFGAPGHLAQAVFRTYEGTRGFRPHLATAGLGRQRPVTFTGLVGYIRAHLAPPRPAVPQ